MTQREGPLNEVSFVLEWNGGGCTSFTVMPFANADPQREATRRAEVTKAHARGIKMDGNLFTRQKQPPRPSPALFFPLRIQRQCPTTEDSDVYGYWWRPWGNKYRHTLLAGCKTIPAVQLQSSHKNKIFYVIPSRQFFLASTSLWNLCLKSISGLEERALTLSHPFYIIVVILVFIFLFLQNEVDLNTLSKVDVCLWRHWKLWWMRLMTCIRYRL